jgi:hypothetical protein
VSAQFWTIKTNVFHPKEQKKSIYWTQGRNKEERKMEIEIE